MNQFSRAHSPPPEEDEFYQSGAESRYAIKLANALKVRLQYARLKVSSGMTNKNLQEVEEAMIPQPSTPTQREEDTGEQEEAAARTIMMLSSTRDKPPSSTYFPPRPVYNHPPSLYDAVAQNRFHYQKSHLSHDNNLRQYKQQRKKSRDHHPHGKEAFQSIKPYTAPRRGRPKKVTTATTS